MSSCKSFGIVDLLLWLIDWTASLHVKPEVSVMCTFIILKHVGNVLGA
jgi:hypothetical protein